LAKQNAAARHSADAFWKELVIRFFYEMLRRCIPELYERADKNKPPVFLDKELRSIARKVKLKLRVADLLISVPLSDGKNTWILLHCELQGKGGGNLAERMFMYMTLIFSRCAKPVVGLAIVTDKRSAAEPTFYELSLFGAETIYRYNRIAIADLDPEELKTSDNPFDLALYAGQCAIKAKRSERQRFIFFKELLTLLSLRSWSRTDKDDFLVFLDGILHISDKDAIMELSMFEEEILKGEKPMALQDMKTPLRTYIYEKGIEKGREEGIEEGIEKGIEKGYEETARKMLKKGYDHQEIIEITGISIDKLKTLAAS
jgi:predicted transposase YdaD